MKDRKINLRLTDEEHKEIQKKADELGMSVSQYIRLTALKGLEVKLKEGLTMNKDKNFTSTEEMLQHESDLRYENEQSYRDLEQVPEEY